MAGRLHEVVTDEICLRHGAQRFGFLRSVLALAREEREPADSVEEIRRAFGAFKPDAWKICRAERQIVCWEVSISNGLSSKVGRYIDAFWAFDDAAWEVVLVNVDAGGIESRVDLTLLALDALRATPSQTGSIA